MRTKKSKILYKKGAPIVSIQSGVFKYFYKQSRKLEQNTLVDNLFMAFTERFFLIIGGSLL